MQGHGELGLPHVRRDELWALYAPTRPRAACILRTRGAIDNVNKARKGHQSKSKIDEDSLASSFGMYPIGTLKDEETSYGPPCGFKSVG